MILHRPMAVRAWAAAAGAVLLLAGAAARAENLDAGKSGATLFAGSCATCHRSARGLAKGRFRLTLYLFLQQHYAASSDSASTLAAYLQSVDMPAAAPAARAVARRGIRTVRPPRPPMPVPHPQLIGASGPACGRPRGVRLCFASSGTASVLGKSTRQRD
jgi:mono/diheme cytochrome c family protein